MVAIRPATEDDRDAIHSVHVAAIEAGGRRAYDDLQVVAWAASPDPNEYVLAKDRVPCFVAERGGPVAGFAQVDLDAGHFEKLYVHPDHARRGIATTLVERVESAAVDDGVEELTVVASRNAVGFYERAGYEHEATIDKTLTTPGGESVAIRCVRLSRQLTR